MTIPLVTALTFTPYTFRCAKCRRLARASKEAIALHREHNPTTGLSDRDIANTFKQCLTCANPEMESHEIVLEGPWRIPNLTADDIFALDAALELAGDDEEEPYPGLWDVHEKVRRVVDDVRAVGRQSRLRTAAR